MILVLAANTAFADFPRLANFHAGDNFLPRQFTTRGHRLVFSNGIIALAAAASRSSSIAFGADVTQLIPFYAIGVFTSFTLSQAGHGQAAPPDQGTGLAGRSADQRPGRDRDGRACTIVIGVTKFTHGAWAVIVLVPVMVLVLVRMNRQYEREDDELGGALVRLDAERRSSGRSWSCWSRRSTRR